MLILIEYLDGKIEEHKSRCLFRADSVGGIYRILDELGQEITIPFAVVRKTTMIKERVKE